MMYDVVVAGLNECQVKTTELECDVYDVEIAVTSGTLNALIRPLRILFQHPCPFTKNLWACEGFGGSLGYLGRVGNKYWNPYHGSQKKLTCCKNNSSKGVELIWGCFPHIMSCPEPTSAVAWFISGLGSPSAWDTWSLNSSKFKQLELLCRYILFWGNLSLQNPCLHLNISWPNLEPIVFLHVFHREPW